MKMDSLESLEFDLSEAVKDLIYAIKSLKKDIDLIKQYLDLD